MMHIDIDITVEEHIDAAPSTVYSLVADLARMGEWSPENAGGDWLEGGPGVAGSRFVGHNRTATEAWDGALTVTVADGFQLEWVMGDDSTCPQGTWRYSFMVSGRGTRVVERYTLGPGASGFRDELDGFADDVVAAIVDARRTELREGMQVTLRELKRTAEGRHR